MKPLVVHCKFFHAEWNGHNIDVKFNVYTDKPIYTYFGYLRNAGFITGTIDKYQCQGIFTDVGQWGELIKLAKEFDERE